jgi:hypothetical protein
VARTTYLAGTSIFARLTQPAVAAAFAPLVAGARLAGQGHHSAEAVDPEEPPPRLAAMTHFRRDQAS